MGGDARLRTRSSHREIDREKVEVGEKFSNGCRYPGDPEAPYAQTANCRCTLVACCDGLDVLDGERFSRLPEGMTYEEWKAGKPAVNGTKPANRTISEFMEMPGTKRKLDVAGVSKTEARKRLSRQLEDYGIPSSGFRKMSAGDQQKVLDTVLAPGSTPIVNGRRVSRRSKASIPQAPTLPRSTRTSRQRRTKTAGTRTTAKGAFRRMRRDGVGSTSLRSRSR